MTEEKAKALREVFGGDFNEVEYGTDMMNMSEMPNEEDNVSKKTNQKNLEQKKLF